MPHLAHVGELERFSDCQIRDVVVNLVDQRHSPAHVELLARVSIVTHMPLHAHELRSLQPPWCNTLIIMLTSFLRHLMLHKGIYQCRNQQAVQ